MRFVHCVSAELTLVRPLVLRTGLGLWLVALGAVLLWLGRDGDPRTTALLAGALGAILGAHAASRGAGLSLAHPTTPLAVATGRWLCSVGPATILALCCVLARGGGAGDVLAGGAAAAAVGGCAIAAALLQRSLLPLLFLCMAAAGTIPPEELVAITDPGVARVFAASVLEIGPALWRYRGIATDDAGALAHALLWAALGIVLAGGLLRRIRA